MFRYKLVLEKLQRKERKYSEVPVGRNRSFRRYTTSEERTIWLKADQKTYEDRLILPGELYKVTLNSMTSEEQACLRPPRGFFLSRPGPPGKVRSCLGDLVHISFFSWRLLVSSPARYWSLGAHPLPLGTLQEMGTSWW